MTVVVIGPTAAPKSSTSKTSRTPSRSWRGGRAVRAVALNHLDLWVRQGLPGAPFHLPAITGADAAGDVYAVGAGVDDLAIGTPVMVLPGVSCGVCAACLMGADQLCASYGILGESCDGALAELVKVPRANVVAKPANVSYEAGAALSLTFLTAWHMLVARARAARRRDGAGAGGRLGGRRRGRSRSRASSAPGLSRPPAARRSARPPRRSGPRSCSTRATPIGTSRSRA